MIVDGGLLHREVPRIKNPPRLLLSWVLGVCISPVNAQPTPIPQPTVPPTPVITIATPVLSAPHSVAYDALSDLYLVSNENPPSGDNNGFISRVAPDGRVLNLKWIEGGWGKSTLDTPRGIALGTDDLHVTDGNSIHGFDRRTGRAVSSVMIPEATTLEFIALHSDGRMFVSDTGARKADPESTTTMSLASVYEVSGIGLARECLSAAEFPNVRGLAVEGDALYAVDGEDLVRYDLTGGPTERFAGPGGALHGLTRLPNGDLMTTLHARQRLLKWNRDSGFVTLADGIDSLSTPGWDTRRGRAIVANREQGTIRFVSPKPE